MPSIPSSQGATVSFDGVPLGQLLTIDASGGSASAESVTSLESAVLGSGADARVIKDVDVLSVDSGRCSVTFFGAPQVVECGKKAELEVVIGGATVLSGEAFLQDYDCQGAVGELVRGSATFQMTGS